MLDYWRNWAPFYLFILLSSLLKYLFKTCRLAYWLSFSHSCVIPKYMIFESYIFCNIFSCSWVKLFCFLNSTFTKLKPLILMNNWKYFLLLFFLYLWKHTLLFFFTLYTILWMLPYFGHQMCVGGVGVLILDNSVAPGLRTYLPGTRGRPNIYFLLWITIS